MIRSPVVYNDGLNIIQLAEYLFMLFGVFFTVFIYLILGGIDIFTGALYPVRKYTPGYPERY